MARAGSFFKDAEPAGHVGDVLGCGGGADRCCGSFGLGDQDFFAGLHAFLQARQAILQGLDVLALLVDQRAMALFKGEQAVNRSDGVQPGFWAERHATLEAVLLHQLGDERLLDGQVGIDPLQEGGRFERIGGGGVLCCRTSAISHLDRLPAHNPLENRSRA